MKMWSEEQVPYNKQYALAINVIIFRWEPNHKQHFAFNGEFKSTKNIDNQYHPMLDKRWGLKISWHIYQFRVPNL